MVLERATEQGTTLSLTNQQKEIVEPLIADVVAKGGRCEIWWTILSAASAALPPVCRGGGVVGVSRCHGYY
jgi:hypothetical protein